MSSNWQSVREGLAMAGLYPAWYSMLCALLLEESSARRQERIFKKLNL